MFDQVDSALVMQPEIIHKASLYVCGTAENIDDARILLDMLGLHEDKARFPSWTVTPSSNRRAPSTVPAAPLPSSGYGAVQPGTPA